MSRFNKIEKLEECYKKRAKELGLIGYDGETFIFIRNSKTSKMVDFNLKMM